MASQGASPNTEVVPPAPSLLAGSPKGTGCYERNGEGRHGPSSWGAPEPGVGTWNQRSEPGERLMRLQPPSSDGTASCPCRS